MGLTTPDGHLDGIARTIDDDEFAFGDLWSMKNQRERRHTAFWVVLDVISLGSPISLRTPMTSMMSWGIQGIGFKPTVPSFSTSPNLSMDKKLKRACGKLTFSLH